MQAPKQIDTGFGYSLAPIDLQAAHHAAERLHHLSINPPAPQYPAGSSHGSDFHRSSFTIPLAYPRSTYSEPLAGGEQLSELLPGTHEILSQNPRAVDACHYVPVKVEPTPGLYTPFVRGGTDPSQLRKRRVLVVERMIPKRASRSPDAKILLLAHGLGFSKECFVPILDEIIRRQPYDIEEVWMIDTLGHGMSAVVNRQLDEPSPLEYTDRCIDCNDLSRDILQFICCFMPSTSTKTPVEPSRTLDFHLPRLPRKRIVGIGHSFGGAALHQAAHHFPDLFDSVILVESILSTFQQVERIHAVPLARYTLMKKDRWNTREEARAEADQDKHMRLWHPSVRDAFAAGNLTESLTQPGTVERSADKVAEALSIRGNRPGVQVSQYLHCLPARLPVLFVSAHKPLLLPLEEIFHTAQSIPNLHFEVMTGTHNLPHEKPHQIAERILRFWRETSLDSPMYRESRL
ncbi:alpha/beta-hydrolase [Testicularia cyperi]|uniref:Alpha/beta-hydrolase n=1 Tax=Testicularia cyperi TaxID=1882483 RepID=A0A317XQ41_9BASI|nr:alpha/beta-hydrolase [Testicularia cyperi]